MAAQVIQANYEALEEIARRFNAAAQAAAQMRQRVAQAGDALAQGGWQGRGATAFTGEMTREVLPALTRLSAALNEAGATTLRIRDVVRAAEEEAARPFRGSPADEARRTAGDMISGVAGVFQVREPVSEANKSWWERHGEKIHAGLDVLGFIPAAGAVPDVINGLIYLGEGRYVEAAISAGAAIPLFGDAGKAAHLGYKATRELAEQAAQEAAERAAREAAEHAAREAAERVARETAGEGSERIIRRTAVPAPGDFVRFPDLSPNSRYVYDNGYEYATDGVGRVTEISADLRHLDVPRTGHQTEVGRMGLPDDDGGHFIGNRFGGTPEGPNLFPQNSNFNRGAYRLLEDTWSRAISEGRQVSVDIRVYYDPVDNLRPDKLVVDYTIDGAPQTRIFRNQPGGG